jgi:hypothetical protein
VRRSLVVLIILATVLALSIGTALAENKPADKGGGKGQEQQGASKTTAAQGQQRQAANKVSAATSQVTDDNTSYGFKGNVAQNGADGSPLEVKVEKANDDARSFVGKSLKFNVSSDTEIYRDESTDAESSDLDAKLTDLKQGDKVLIQAKAPKNATSFTASLISAEASDTDSSNTNATNTENTNIG